jgi:hypothetical protein
VVKTLCYKPEGSGFETQWGELIISIYLILPAALGPGVYSATNRNENQKIFVGSRARPVLMADKFVVICELIV